MNRREILGLGVIVSLAAFAAAPASADGKRVALVVGNSALSERAGAAQSGE
jgi:hypothetical protein